jgi:dTDP-glucose pyrophosphorylase
MITKSTKNNFTDAYIYAESKIEDVVNSLNQSCLRICLVVNNDYQLIGTISDGDLRRGMLRGMGLQDSIKGIVKTDPFVVPKGVNKEFVKQIMLANKIAQVPEVNNKNEVIYLHCLEDLHQPKLIPNKFVIMAGGKGERLKPLTDNCPKAMLEVSGKPIIQRIIEQAKTEGFYEFIISVNYLGHVIEDHLKDGKGLGVNIEYIREKKPLGTAGSLTLLKTLPAEPMLVTNGDVLSEIEYSKLLDFHLRYNAHATMAVRLQERQNPYGVVKMDGVKFIGIDEKPKDQFHVNAGIYVISPCALNILEKNKRWDMTELFIRIMDSDLCTYAYPMHEPWLDVGSTEDFQKANKQIT